jgi:hypothetical protein
VNQQETPKTPQHRGSGESTTRLAFIYGTAAVAAMALTIYGYTDGSQGVLALGGLAVVLVLAVAPISFASASREGGIDGPVMDAVLDEIRQLRASVDRLGEYQALSDDARRVLNRVRERDLLVSAIEEDVTAEDWDAAVVLCDELAETETSPPRSRHSTG